MNLAVWYPAAVLGLLALGLWWDTNGADYLRRRSSRLFGTCRGCGRKPANCSCQLFDFKLEDEDD